MYQSLHGPTRNARNVRVSQRTSDISESERLLLELSIAEPTIQQCFRIIETTCLSQGIFCKINGKAASPKLMDHLDEYYNPFCKAALRAMLVYGFVPWRTRKIKDGYEIPEVLPAGTFSWFTECSHKTRGKTANLHDNNSLMVIYRVNPTGGTFKEEDIHIYVHTVPSLDIMGSSILYATVVSPLAHLLTDYKALRQGQIRRSHADAWNTTAKVITEFNPKLRVEDNPSQYLMDFVHEDYFVPPTGGENMYPPFEAHNVWQREQIIRRQFESNPSVHYPEVFALPRDHTIAPQTRLDPCEDIQFLSDKYRRDVCALLGIPLEMIHGQLNHSVTNDNTRKTLASGRIFSTNMQDMCKHIQKLLSHVYATIYGDTEQATFVLVPMPRLEIESINDLKTLHEIGAMTPDMSMQMSKTLLGENNGSKRQKVQHASVENTEKQSQPSDNK